jgi:4-diphosphocytidyl-2-C-methyl-D-erythritol kinase
MAIQALYDVAAPAKINLFLHVIGRRDDGYHLLQSVFVLVDWMDTLHFEVRGDAQLRRHDLTATLPDDDLCLRAARLLQLRSGTRLGADISIDKQVPWGAGLGGGSSDAASVLLALNRLWGLGLPLQQLIAIGLELGADVPFFLGGRNAFVEGIGERLTPVDVPLQWLAVLKPAAAIETRSIFTSPLLVRDTQAVILESFLVDARNLRSRQRDKQALQEPGRDGLIEGACVDWLGDFGRNDLQAAASALCAEVAEAAELLQAQFGNSRMTGSGSAVFARAGTQAQPSAFIPARMAPGWVGRMCRSLEIHPLCGWASD